MIAVSFLDPRLPSRFWEKVQPCPMSGCWLWTGAAQSFGYGSIAVDGTRRTAHSLAYKTLIGSVPDGLELDHKCRVSACCNPLHLEPVTHRENMLRGNTPSAINAAKTHCPNGHPYAAGRKRRACNECIWARDVEYRKHSSKGYEHHCRLCHRPGHNKRTCAKRAA